MQADVPERFAARRRREPGAEVLGLADAVEVLDEPQPGGLRDVRCVRP